MFTLSLPANVKHSLSSELVFLVDTKSKNLSWNLGVEHCSEWYISVATLTVGKNGIWWLFLFCCNNLLIFFFNSPSFKLLYKSLSLSPGSLGLKLFQKKKEWDPDCLGNTVCHGSIHFNSTDFFLPLPWLFFLSHCSLWGLPCRTSPD